MLSEESTAIAPGSVSVASVRLVPLLVPAVPVPTNRSTANVVLAPDEVACELVPLLFVAVIATVIELPTSSNCTE
ncbi:MAG: hypothetical protein EB143_03620 [Actinobacteria bacterium]|nr:hypothetical protein [Actinomycetota bacterium]NDF68596.1 hypothetical protein [Actinomycetota bacterium]NDH36946.1 hypothetical protein [Acidimicrobiia bacterium]